MASTTETENVATERLTAINAALESGKTVYIASAWKIMKITPRTAKKWAESGIQLFKVSGASLYIARGSKWDCIDYCKFTVR